MAPDASRGIGVLRQFRLAIGQIDADDTGNISPGAAGDARATNSRAHANFFGKRSAYFQESAAFLVSESGSHSFSSMRMPLGSKTFALRTLAG